METEKPGVGTGVYIWKDGKVLFGKRIGKAGKGTWSPPGGKLDRYESVEECVIRETREETGLTIQNPKFIHFTNDVELDAKIHFVTLHFSADWITGDPQVMEPDKFECWEWFDWGALPSPLFLAVENLIKSGFNPK